MHCEEGPRPWRTAPISGSQNSITADRRRSAMTPNGLSSGLIGNGKSGVSSRLISKFSKPYQWPKPTALVGTQCRSNPVSGRRLRKTGVFQTSAGDYRLFGSGNLENWSLETGTSSTEARLWRAFPQVPGTSSLSPTLAGWSERIRTYAFPIELSLCALSLEFGNICRLAAQKQGNECSRSLAPARSRRMRAQLTCSLNRRVRRRAKVDEQIAPNAMSNERCRRRRPIHSPRHQLYWQGLSGLVIGAIMTLATVAVPCSRPTCTS